MITRDEFRQQAIGWYATIKPTARLEEMKLYAEGALYAWDYMERKQRQAEYNKAYMAKPAKVPQLQGVHL